MPSDRRRSWWGQEATRSLGGLKLCSSFIFIPALRSGKQISHQIDFTPEVTPKQCKQSIANGHSTPLTLAFAAKHGKI